MGNFTFRQTSISGVIVVEPTVYGDSRGFFLETYHQKDFEMGGISAIFVQDNHSKSSKGVLRGLHFQDRHPQGKLVRVVSGAVFDVAVDIRPNSPTFGKWHGEILSSENYRQLYVPEGLAHGYLTLSDSAEFLYKCTDFYYPDDQSGIIWNDPDIGIKWPDVPESGVILSAKDESNKPLRELMELL